MVGLWRWRLGPMVLSLVIVISACSQGETLNFGGVAPHDQAPSERILTEDDRAVVAEYSKGLPRPSGEPHLPEGATANRLTGGCLRELGVTVSYAGPGGILRPPSDEPRDKSPAPLELCMSQLDADGHITLSTEPDVQARRYEAYLVAYQCLVALGADPASPVARNAFVSGQSSWSPFDGLMSRVDPSQGIVEGPIVECSVP